MTVMHKDEFQADKAGIKEEINVSTSFFGMNDVTHFNSDREPWHIPNTVIMYILALQSK